MVNTRNRGEGNDAVASTADQPRVTATARPPPRDLTLGGMTEHIPQRNLETSDPLIQEQTAETRMMDRMMLAMNRAMSQQQEQFLKILEDRDTSNRKNEAVAENVLGTGSGENAIPTVGTGTVEIGQAGKTCSFKTFLSCRPPEFKGTDDPIMCMNWIREMEQAFRTSECGESQKAKFGSQMLRGAALIWWNVYSTSIQASVLAKLSWEVFKKKVLEQYCNERAMDRIEESFRNLRKGNMPVTEYNRLFMDKLGLVGHLVPSEKEKIKAYLKGLPSDMMTMVRVSKASTLREAIEEAQLVEDAYSRDKEVTNRLPEKRKWESPQNSFKRPRFQQSSRGGDYRREARWCPKCKARHVGSCMPSQVTCFKCGKTGHTSRDCHIKGIVCFECKGIGHV